jgi:hypothetical protein
VRRFVDEECLMVSGAGQCRALVRREVMFRLFEAWCGGRCLVGEERFVECLRAMGITVTDHHVYLAMKAALLPDHVLEV